MHIQQIYIVGSGKTGFSLNPKNLFNPIDYKFNTTGIKKDKSDLDIAIISEELFQKLGKGTFNFTNSYKNKWKTNEFYDYDRSQIFSVPLNYMFYEYYTKGWFRPDFKPYGFEMKYPKIYEQFKRKLYKLLKRKSAFGIYSNWFYFKSYHIESMKYLKNALETETI